MASSIPVPETLIYCSRESSTDYSHVPSPSLLIWKDNILINLFWAAFVAQKASHKTAFFTLHSSLLRPLLRHFVRIGYDASYQNSCTPLLVFSTNKYLHLSKKGNLALHCHCELACLCECGNLKHSIQYSIFVR